MTPDERAQYIRTHVRDIPDFPKPGILFRDITPLLARREGLVTVTEGLVSALAEANVPIDAIVGIEARGFIFGAALAHRLGRPFVPVRKPGKLPGRLDRVSYALEYGENVLEMHQESLERGARVVVVDDLLATGGTAQAAARLVGMQGASVSAFTFVIELVALEGRGRLDGAPIVTLLSYP